MTTYSVPSMTSMLQWNQSNLSRIKIKYAVIKKKVIVSNRGKTLISRRKSIALSETIDFFLRRQTLFALHAKISHLTLFPFSLFFLSLTVDRTGCTFHIFLFLASGHMSISGTWMALRFKDLWKKKRKLNPVNDD